MKVISTNKKAYFDYFIVDTFEAGLVLKGSEVKSIRAGNVNLKDTFISINKDMEVFVKNMYIKKFEFLTGFDIDERMDRKLLLNESEIKKIFSKIKEKGYTCVPLKLYFKGDKVKCEIGLVQGKKLYDKKDAIKENDLKREADRDIKSFKYKNK